MIDIDYYTAFRERARLVRAYGHACERSRLALNRYNQERTESNRLALLVTIDDADAKHAAMAAVMDAMRERET